MPEHRPFPWKFIPRLGCKLSVTFGNSLSPQDIQAALRVTSHEDHRRRGSTSPSQSQYLSSEDTREGDAVDGEDRLFGIDRGQRAREGTTRESTNVDLEDESRKRKIDHVRSMVTAVVQREVEAVGRRVSGDMLGKKVDT